MDIIKNILFPSTQKKHSKKGLVAIIQKLQQITITKRQKFIISVLILSFGLFFSEYLFGKSGVYMVVFLSIITALLLFVSNFNDIKGNFSLSLLTLPFFYTLAFGLFYFIIPARLLTRLVMTLLYAGGLYSVFLSQNIFIVAAMRTIALLSSARTVSFVITIISYFFLSNIIFTLDLPLLPTVLLVFICSFFLISHLVWTYTLDRNFLSQALWVSILSMCLLEVSFLLWFWPSIPTVLALFLTGIFYTFVGLSHVWLDKRLFRNVLWEYIWVIVVVLSILILFTSWRS